jgi:hypothetical protein
MLGCRNPPRICQAGHCLHAGFALLTERILRSLAGSERLPVTQEAEGSNPVAPAKFRLSLAGDWNWLSQPLCFRSRAAEGAPAQPSPQSDTVGSVSDSRLSRRG